jgi:hypothetical protein
VAGFFHELISPSGCFTRVLLTAFLKSRQSSSLKNLTGAFLRKEAPALWAGVEVSHVLKASELAKRILPRPPVTLERISDDVRDLIMAPP